MSTPTISVLVPLYKAEKFIEPCVRSLMNQTFQDVEYIFVDDNSPDNSLELLKKVVNQYPQRISRVKIIHLEKNQGVSAVRNILLREATGEYIQFVDSDDWIEQNMLELLHGKIIAEDADICTCNFYIERQNGRMMKCFCYNDKHDYLRDVLANNWGVVWKMLIRRSLIIENQISFPVGINGGEDYVFCVKAIYNSRKVAFVDKALYHYVTTNPNSLITNKRISDILQQIEATNCVDEYLKQSKDYSLYKTNLDMRKYIVRTQLRKMSHEIYSDVDYKYFDYLIKIFKQKFTSIIQKIK